jgi:hypothetical protein
MLAERYGNVSLALVVLEITADIALIVFDQFLSALHFTRRHTLPRLFIAYYLFALAVTGSDLLLSHWLAGPELAVDHADTANLMRLAIYTLIWSLYFLTSKRVKATFTRRRINSLCF